MTSLMELPDYQITIFFNFASFLMITGLLSLSNYFRQKSVPAKLFMALCFCNQIDALISILFYYGYATGKMPPVIVSLLIALSEITVLVLSVMWIMYIIFLLYKSRDFLLRCWHFFSIAPAILALGIIVTEILMASDDYDIFLETLELYMNLMVMVLFIVYLVISVIFIYRYKKKGNIVAFKIWPFSVPIVFTVVISVATVYYVRTLGFTIALINMYFSMIATWKYEEIGKVYLNRAYFEKIINYAKSGERQYNGALMFEISGDSETFSEIVSAEMPKNIELIRWKENVYIAFLEIRNRNFLESMVNLIEDSIKEYGEDHPNKKIYVNITKMQKKHDETTEEFINGIVNKDGKEKI